MPHASNEKVSIDQGTFQNNKQRKLIYPYNPRLPDTTCTSRTINRQINGVNH